MTMRGIDWTLIGTTYPITLQHHSLASPATCNILIIPNITTHTNLPSYISTSKPTTKPYHVCAVLLVLELHFLQCS